MVEEKKADNHLPLLLSIAVIMVIVMMGFASVHFAINIHDHQTVDKLRDEIQNRNVSSEYRQGWNDCIERFEYWWNKAENVTNSVAKLMN